MIFFICKIFDCNNAKLEFLNIFSCPQKIQQGQTLFSFSFSVFYDIVNHYLYNKPLIYAALFITLLSLVGDIAYLDIQYQVRTEIDSQLRGVVKQGS